MKLSNRMSALAHMVNVSGCFADIGCDHGYLPIYLVQERKVEQAIAMDINAGPLDRAREHIVQEGLQERIQLRLSDGLAALEDEEADVILIAGMGGGIILHILEQDLVKACQAQELILQPQSEIAQVREYLCGKRFHFLQENIVLEDGKYYPMMKVRYMPDREPVVLTREELEYGPLLLQHPSLVLRQYLDKELQTKTNILLALEKKGLEKENIRRRYEEVKQELVVVKRAQQLTAE